MKKLRVVIISFIVCSVAAAAGAAAQETTGTISGRIVDAQGLAVPGVTVTATGSQGAKTVVSDTEGRFTVPFLTPGPYAVHAELQGFNAVDRSDVQVRLGQTVEIPVTLQIGTLTETIQVRGGSPAVDTTSTTIGANLDSTTLSRLPVGRRFSDTLYLTPGVSTGGNVGIANPSIEGSSGLENQYVVDGVNITNGGYGALGSYSIVFGSLGNGTPFDFMQEVQVKTGGYEAAAMPGCADPCPRTVRAARITSRMPWRHRATSATSSALKESRPPSFAIYVRRSRRSIARCPSSTSARCPSVRSWRWSRERTRCTSRRSLRPLLCFFQRSGCMACSPTS